jgi:hypothetical protein
MRSLLTQMQMLVVGRSADRIKICQHCENNWIAFHYAYSKFYSLQCTYIYTYRCFLFLFRLKTRKSLTTSLCALHSTFCRILLVGQSNVFLCFASACG